MPFDNEEEDEGRDRLMSKVSEDFEGLDYLRQQSNVSKGNDGVMYQR